MIGNYVAEAPYAIDQITDISPVTGCQPCKQALGDDQVGLDGKCHFKENEGPYCFKTSGCRYINGQGPLCAEMDVTAIEPCSLCCRPSQTLWYSQTILRPQVVRVVLEIRGLPPNREGAERIRRGNMLRALVDSKTFLPAIAKAVQAQVSGSYRGGNTVPRVDVHVVADAAAVPQISAEGSTLLGCEFTDGNPDRLVLLVNMNPRGPAYEQFPTLVSWAFHNLSRTFRPYPPPNLADTSRSSIGSNLTNSSASLAEAWMVGIPTGQNNSDAIGRAIDKVCADDGLTCGVLCLGTPVLRATLLEYVV